MENVNFNDLLKEVPLSVILDEYRQSQQDMAMSIATDYRRHGDAARTAMVAVYAEADMTDSRKAMLAILIATMEATEFVSRKFGLSPESARLSIHNAVDFLADHVVPKLKSPN